MSIQNIIKEGNNCLLKKKLLVETKEAIPEAGISIE